MKIAITTPTNWPYVRRGGERFVNELADWLGGRGHQVTILCGKPGRGEVVERPTYRTRYLRRLWHPALARLGYLEFHAFFLRLFPELLRGGYDVVHCCTFLDAWAAILARRLTGTPCVFWVNSLPPTIPYIRSLTLRGAILRRAMRDSDEVVALSEYMCSELQARYGRGGRVLPPPVDLSAFPLRRGRDRERPVVLCAMALDDERKGARLLMRAFDRLKARRPTARLRLAGHASDALRTELLQMVSPEWRADVEFLGTGRLKDLPRLYGEAAATVLPSLWEGFGLVVAESLATGTPVAGTRHGAIPELLSDPSIGCLFDPGPVEGAAASNVDGLAEAMDRAIALSADERTPDRCRDRAVRWSWDEVGPAFERLFSGLAGAGTTGAPASPPRREAV